MDRSGAGFALLLGACLGIAQPAAAGLEICNDTPLMQSIAIGYKGDSDWMSEGWWNVEPGDCALVVAGDLKKRYYYYFAEAEGRKFEGQNYMFCVRDDEFTIQGDTECEKRGYQALGFREIDTGETATEFTLSLVDRGARPAAPSATAPPATAAPPAGDFRSGDSQSTTVAPQEPSVSVSTENLTSGLPPGRHGDPFRVEALFQGCELEEGTGYCGFHASGWKLRAFYGAPTPADLLYALEVLPINTPVRLEGDLVETGVVHAAVVIREVVPQPGSDRFAETRAALQGDWVNLRDAGDEFTLRGSEIYRRRDGAFVETRFVQLAPSCAAADGAAAGAGPALTQMTLDRRAQACFVISAPGDGTLEMRDSASGETQRYRKTR